MYRAASVELCRAVVARLDVARAVPNSWPGWATSQADGEFFAACRQHGNCWLLARNDVPARVMLPMLVVSLVGIIGGTTMLVCCSWRVLRRRANPQTVLFWTLALVLQSSLLLTSAFEAGIERYTNAIHVLGVALSLWLLSMVLIGRTVLPPSGSRVRAAAASLHREAVLFFGLFTIGILAGILIFLLCSLFGVLSSIHILFFRGLLLIVIAMFAHAFLLGMALSWVRRRGLSSSVGVPYLLPIVLVSAALNFGFFVLVPVNLDRSISVFLLAWMEDHHGTLQTKADLQDAFERIYIDLDGALDRRIAEQLASGNIVRRGNGYVLTQQGSQFVSIARSVGLLFSTDQRFLHPDIIAYRAPDSSPPMSSDPSTSPR